MVRAVIVLSCAVAALAAPRGAAASDPLPRFTEEREAAATHFVRKHCPELLPLLDELKRTSRPAYEMQIRETFQVSELLAELQDDAKRHDLELNFWKAENKALLLVAKHAAAKDEERKAVEEQLHELARELVELDVQSLEYRAEVLRAELAATKDDLSKLRDNLDRAAKDRFDALLEKARRKKP